MDVKDVQQLIRLKVQDALAKLPGQSGLLAVLDIPYTLPSVIPLNADYYLYRLMEPRKTKLELSQVQASQCKRRRRTSSISEMK